MTEFFNETVAVRCDCQTEYKQGRWIPNAEGSGGFVKFTAFDPKDREREYGVLTGILFSAETFPQDAGQAEPELRDIAAAVCNFDTDFSMELPRTYCPILPQYTVRGNIQKDDAVLVLRSLRTEKARKNLDIGAALLTEAYFSLNRERGGKLGAVFVFLNDARKGKFYDLLLQCGYRQCESDPNVYALRLPQKE